MKYVVDTSLINKLVDGSVESDELPKDGSFVASHVQIDEINRTTDAERKLKLLEKFKETIDEVLPTESFVLGASQLGGGKLGNGVAYQSIKADLDARNKGKPNNSKDALIAEVAMINGYTLLTADYDLYQVSYAKGIGTMYWTTYQTLRSRRTH
jgi:predicted nucleic acid-binding protein